MRKFLCTATSPNPQTASRGVPWCKSQIHWVCCTASLYQSCRRCCFPPGQPAAAGVWVPAKQQLIEPWGHIFWKKSISFPPWSHTENWKDSMNSEQQHKPQRPALCYNRLTLFLWTMQFLTFAPVEWEPYLAYEYRTTIQHLSYGQVGSKFRIMKTKYAPDWLSQPGAVVYFHPISDRLAHWSLCVKLLYKVIIN